MNLIEKQRELWDLKAAASEILNAIAYDDYASRKDWYTGGVVEEAEADLLNRYPKELVDRAMSLAYSVAIRQVVKS